MIISVFDHDREENIVEKGENAGYQYDREENIVENGENAGYQHFSPFPTLFSVAFSCRVSEI